MGVEWKAVSHKRKCLKVWKTGENRDAYEAAKRTSSLAVHIAKSDAEKIALKQINPSSVKIYIFFYIIMTLYQRLSKSLVNLKLENQKCVGRKIIKQQLYKQKKDLKYIEKLRQNNKFKFFRVFMIHNFESNF